MIHARTSIRRWVATTLADALVPGTVTRVDTSRVHRYPVYRLPAINVLTAREEATEDATRQSEYREVDVEVAIRVKGGSALDDQLDQIALELEAVLLAAPRPDNVLTVAYARTDVAQDDSSDQPTGLMQITYSVLYRVTPGQPVL